MVRDNGAALGALIKANSSHRDVGNVAAAVHLVWAQRNARVWFEWVASDDNCADGLSRAGLADPWALRQVPAWDIVERTALVEYGMRSLPMESGEACRRCPPE